MIRRLMRTYQNTDSTETAVRRAGCESKAIISEMPWIQVRVPASSANLGPGFDAMGLALDLHLTCRFRPSPSLIIRARGTDTHDIPLDDNNLIWRTALEVAARVDLQLSPIELEIDNAIPLGKGLGSSAAALTAG